MVSEITRNVVDGVLQARLGPHFNGADIVSRRDSDGDPALYIHARFDPPDAIPPSMTIVDTMVALRDALVALDDDRFPYLRPVYPEEPVNHEAA